MSDIFEDIQDLLIFKWLIVTLLILGLLWLLELLFYHKLRFPSNKTLDRFEQEKVTHFIKHSISQKNDFVKRLENKRNVKFDTKATNAYYKAKEMPSSSVWFPMLRTWPCVYFPFFILIPLCLACLIIYLIDLEDIIHIYDINYTSFDSSFSAEDIKYEDVLFRVSHISFWLGSYFLGLMPVAEFMRIYSGSASEYLYKIFPLSFGRLIYFHLLLSSSFFLIVSLVSTSLTLMKSETSFFTFTQLNNGENSEVLQKISILVSLVLLCYVQAALYRGFFIFLSILSLDFFANFRAFWSLLELAHLISISYVIFTINEWAGRLIAVSIVLFNVITGTLNFFFGTEFLNVNTDPSGTDTDALNFQFDASDGIAQQVSYHRALLKLTKPRDIGEIGQLVRVSILSCDFSSSIFSVLDYDKNDLSVKLIRARQRTQAYNFYHWFLEESFQAFSYIYLFFLSPFVLLTFISKGLIAEDFPVDKLTKRQNNWQDLSLRISLPHGRPLIKLYEQINSTKVLYFFVSKTGLSSSFSHFLKCYKEKIRSCFTFYCEDFGMLLSIINFLINVNIDFYRINKENISFVFKKKHQTPAIFLKNMFLKLKTTLVRREYIKDDNDYSSKRLVTFLCNNSYISESDFGFIPDFPSNVGAGKILAMTCLGSSSLYFAIKNMVNRKFLLETEWQRSRIKFYEFIIEPTLFNFFDASLVYNEDNM